MEKREENREIKLYFITNGTLPVLAKTLASSQPMVNSDVQNKNFILNCTRIAHSDILSGT